MLEAISKHLGVEYISQVETVNQNRNVNQLTQDVSNLSNLSNEADVLEQLSQMPPDWVLQIQYAAASCSDELLIELLEQIPPAYHLLSRVFRDLANNYRFEKITELIRAAAE